MCGSSWIHIINYVAPKVIRKFRFLSMETRKNSVKITDWFWVCLWKRIKISWIHHGKSKKWSDNFDLYPWKLESCVCDEVWKTPKIVKENKNLMNLSSISAKSAIPNKLVISRTYAALPWIDLHWFGFGKVSFFLLLSLGICEKGWNLFCRYILIMSVGLESKSEIMRRNILAIRNRQWKFHLLHLAFLVKKSAKKQKSPWK